MRSLIFGLVLSLSFASIARSEDHTVGNGGDKIREAFMERGEKIVALLKGPMSGFAVSEGLDASKLAGTLTIKKITVTEQPLIDNTGSVVDALGVPGMITLNGPAWNRYFEQKRYVDDLILHEMLRSAAVNDDDYRISKKYKFSLKGRLNAALAKSGPMALFHGPGSIGSARREVESPVLRELNQRIFLSGSYSSPVSTLRLEHEILGVAGEVLERREWVLYSYSAHYASQVQYIDSPTLFPGVRVPLVQFDVIDGAWRKIASHSLELAEGF